MPVLREPELSTFRCNVFRNNTNANGTGGNAILILEGNNYCIDNNEFEGGHTSAAVNLSGRYGIGNVCNVTITHNRMRADKCIALTSSSHVRIAHNTLVQTAGSAVFFGGNTNHTEIDDNVIAASQHAAIRVTTAFVPGAADQEHFCARQQHSGQSNGH